MVNSKHCMEDVKMKVRLSAPVFGIAILLVLVLAGCSAAAQPTAAPQPAVQEELPPVRASSSVIAEGRVIPAQDASLSFQTGGVVGEVLVKEGDLVQAGQPLIRLVGDEQIQAAVSTAELELLSAQQALDDLYTNLDVARAQAQLAIAEARKELDKAEKRLDSRDYRRGDQEQVDIARSNYIIAEDGVSEAEELYDRVDDRDEDDPVRAEAFSQLAAARQRRDTALANLNYLLAKPNELDVAQIDANLAVAQSNLADAQRRYDRLQNGPDAQQLALAEGRLSNAKVNLDAARARLDDLELTAPFAGTVSTLEATVGEFVSPGMAVARLADFSTWYVETTDLTELSVARITLGQPAMVQFDALPDVGSIGRVTTIEPFGENRQGDIVYTVVLRLEAPDENLRWNMTSSVEFLEKEE
jgi:HlyD family secretion protein